MYLMHSWREDAEANKIQLHTLGIALPPMARLTASELASAILTSWKERLQVEGPN